MEKKKFSIDIFREYKKRIFSARFLCAVILMFIVVMTFYDGTMKFIEKKDVSITPWTAIFLFNFDFDTAIFGLIVCYMYSDIPFMKRDELPFLLRKGRIKWYVEKLIAVVLQAATFVAFTFVSCALCFIPRLELSMEWGRVIRTLAGSQVGSQYNTMMVSRNVISKYTPIEATTKIFMLAVAVTTMVGILMLILALLINRTTAMTAGICLSVLSIASQNANVHSVVPYIIYLCPFSWCDITKFNVKFFKIRYGTYESYMTICAIVITICVVVGLLRIRKAEFNWNRED